MIDPLTLTGAAAGILALAEACFKTARLFYEFSNNNEIAVDEIYRFYLNLRSFSDGIALAHMELRPHCKAHSDSPAIEYIQTRRVLDVLSKRSDLVDDSLTGARRWVRSQKGRNKLLITLKWFLNKKRIMALEPEMESVISRLQLIILIVKSEAIEMKTETSHASADDKEDIALLKDVIKTQIKHIKMLETRQRRTARPFGSIMPRSFSSLETADNEALLELGETIAQREVPGTTHAARPKSPPSKSPPSEQMQGDTKPRRSVVYNNGSSSKAPWSPKSTEPEPAAPGKSVTDLGQSQAGVSGYVITPNRPARFVTAVINNRQRGNAMSSSVARRLDLVVTPLAEMDPLLWLEDTWYPVQNAVGKVHFRWRASASEVAESQSPEVECVILENQQQGLVFGRSFHRRMLRQRVSTSSVLQQGH